MGPYVLGAGMILSAYGTLKASRAQADAEMQNARFFREQAAFAEITGRRQADLIEDDTILLIGDQAASFARAGSSSASSAHVMANTLLQRGKELSASIMETEMNVRLATLRAQQAEKMASDVRKAGVISAIGGVVGAAGSFQNKKG